MAKLTLPDAILHPTPRVLRQFAAGLVCASSLLAFTQRASSSHAVVWLALAVLAAALAIGAPRVLRPLFIVLSAVTFPVGFVLQRVLLGAFFFCAFTPFALVLRGVRRARRGDEPHRWRVSAPRPATEAYFRPY